MTTPDITTAESILEKKIRVLGDPVTFSSLMEAIAAGNWTAEDARRLKAYKRSLIN